MPNIVTFREKTRKILRDYFSIQENDEKGQKRAIIVFDGYIGGPNTKDTTHRTSNKVNIAEGTKFVGKKEDFLSNLENKQSLINLISQRMKDRGCHVIQSKGDADVEIVKAAVSISSNKSTSVIGEDTDLLVLLLHHAPTSNDNKVYFYSDKVSPATVYDIKVMKKLLGYDVCSCLLFLHAFMGCDTTSAIFGIGKKLALHKVLKGNSVLKSCAKIFSTPKKSIAEIQDVGCKAMVALFGGKPGDNLSAMRYSSLCQKVGSAKSFVTPERLPPTSSATKYHALRSYLQVMFWMKMVRPWTLLNGDGNCRTTV